MHALREAVAAIRRAPVLTTLSAGMVGLALLVVGLFGLVTHNLQQALDRVEERVEVVAYIRDTARRDEITLAEESLLEMEEVAAVRFVSKDAALESARSEFPEFRDIFSDLEVNPLPASLEIELREGFRSPEAIARVAGLASLYEFVEEVAYGQDWVSRLYTLRRVGAVATTILGIAFAIVAALIIGTAIRIAVFARREEIQIMRLVGATNGFIRRPFLVEGFLTGIAGGILAIVLTYTAYMVGYRVIFPMDWIPAAWVVGGALAGGLFGVLASAAAIRKHLREV